MKAGEPGRARNRRGTSLPEVLVAIAILGIGLGSVAALTRLSVSALVRVRATDEAHAVLQSFVDSTSAAGTRPFAGSRELDFGKLSWEVPASPGAVAWARFEHQSLPAPVEIAFVVRTTP